MIVATVDSAATVACKQFGWWSQRVRSIVQALCDKTSPNAEMSRLISRAIHFQMFFRCSYATLALMRVYRKPPHEMIRVVARCHQIRLHVVCLLRRFNLHENQLVSGCDKKDHQGWHCFVLWWDGRFSLRTYPMTTKTSLVMIDYLSTTVEGKTHNIHPAFFVFSMLWCFLIGEVELCNAFSLGNPRTHTEVH